MSTSKLKERKGNHVPQNENGYLLIGLTIDLGNGKSSELKVFEGEDVMERSMNFCLENSLDPKIAEVLAMQIHKILEAR
jgi:hypothetical protein